MTAILLSKSIELPAVPLLRQSVSQGIRALIPFSQRVRGVLADPSLDELLARKPELESGLIQRARQLGRAAYPDHHTTDRQSAPWIDHSARDELHRALLLIYQQHLRLPLDEAPDYQFHPLVCRLMRELEIRWEHDMLRRAHPLYEHDLYSFVASEAKRHQLEWFFRMECAGEAAFDDLVALAQVGTRGDVKIEMASNYWDEMGRGKSHAVHTHLFFNLITGLALEPPQA